MLAAILAAGIVIGFALGYVFGARRTRRACRNDYRREHQRAERIKRSAQRCTVPAIIAIAAAYELGRRAGLRQRRPVERRP